VTGRRWLMALLAVALAVPVALYAGLTWVTQSQAARAWMQSAASRALGHPVRIAGPIAVGLGLIPRLVVQNVTVLNGPGFSRPELALARRVEARLAVFPLLSGTIELRDLRLRGFDARFERDAAGRGNWQVTRVPGPSSPVQGTSRRLALRVRSISLQDGVLAWAGPSRLIQAKIPLLTASGTNALAIHGSVELMHTTLQVQGAMGASAPWPVSLGLTGTGVSVAADLRAGVISLKGQLDPAVLGTDRRLAGLGPLSVQARLAPGAASLHATLGPSRLGGARVSGARLDAPAFDQPIRLRVEFAQASLAAETAPPATVLAGSALPFAVALWNGSGSFTLQGTLAQPASFRGLDAAVAGHATNLTAFGGPALGPVAVAAHLTGLTGPAPGIAIRALQVQAAASDLEGDLALTFAPRVGVRGTLVSQRLVLPGWRRPRTPSPATPPSPAPPAPPPPPPQVVPDTPLPLGLLRAADADITYHAVTVTAPGLRVENVAAHLRLAAGQLRLDPMQADVPGGLVTAQATLDASAAPPTAHLVVQAPSLDLAGLLPGASGTAELSADLASTGATLRQLADSVTGAAHVTLVNGALDAAIIPALGAALRATHLPINFGNRILLRCAVIGAAARDGNVSVNPLLLDAGRVALDGTGLADIRTETLGLQLAATVRLGSTGVAVPFQVGGTFAAPHVQAGATQGRLGPALGNDPCGPALAAARGGRPGPEPSPVKRARAGDLLRQFLR